MTHTLEEIYRTKTFTNKMGKCVDIHSETSRDQCNFLQGLIRKNSFKKSIEIGFAYGLSTIAISEVIAENGGNHVVIDKFQNSEWGGVGLEVVQKAGLESKLLFYEEYCYQILPKLLENGEKFDFAYIDSTKQFDWLLVDFFYLDRLVVPGGLIVFDDVVFPGIRKLLRYLSQFPHYEVSATYPESITQKKSKKVELLSKLFPFLNSYMKEDYLKFDSELGINTHCVALKKMKNDTRKWDWHKSF